RDLTQGTSRNLFEADGHEEMRSLAFSPDGRTLAVADPNAGGVRRFEMPTGEEDWLESDWDEGDVGRVAFSPDGRALAGLSDGEGLEIWSVGSWARRWSLPGATAFAFAP